MYLVNPEIEEFGKNPIFQFPLETSSQRKSLTQKFNFKRTKKVILNNNLPFSPISKGTKPKKKPNWGNLPKNWNPPVP